MTSLLGSEKPLSGKALERVTIVNDAVRAIYATPTGSDLEEIELLRATAVKLLALTGELGEELNRVTAVTDQEERAQSIAADMDAELAAWSRVNPYEQEAK
jgi:ABC-type hemin transport system substrate-binding protein